MKAQLTLTFALLFVCIGTGAALAQTPDGMPPARETICDNESGAAFGLCNAYCEAMDCDSASPQASATAGTRGGRCAGLFKDGRGGRGAPSGAPRPPPPPAAEPALCSPRASLPAEAKSLAPSPRVRPPKPLITPALFSRPGGVRLEK